MLDIPDDMCRRCFIWNAACVAQLRSDPESADIYARFCYFFDVPFSLLEDLCMRVLEATYHTRNLTDIKCIRMAFRLGIKVIDDMKTMQASAP